MESSSADLSCGLLLTQNEGQVRIHQKAVDQFPRALSVQFVFDVEVYLFYVVMFNEIELLLKECFSM